jgi:phosphoglycolate phosphatase
MNNKKCVVFDLDGTLLDTLVDLKNSVNFVLRGNGFSERSLEEIRAFVGNGIENLMRRALPSDISEDVFQKCFGDFKAYYKVHSEDFTKEYDGISEVLKKLKANGFYLAVVSNKADFAVSTLCEKFFPNIFDYAFGEREGVRRKPYPDSLNEIIKKLGVKKEDAYYVGDSEVDIKTAHNAAVKCIACTWGFRERNVLEAEAPEYIINSPTEILEILAEEREAWR